MPPFMAHVDRFEENIHKIKQASSHPAAPAGPFSVSMSRPFPANVRDAHPGERELFKYVGPKYTPSTTHAPPAAASQTLFEVTTVQPATPLRSTTTTVASFTEPDVLLRAALRLVDGYQPMPRKRELILQLMDQFESLKQTNEELDDLLADLPEPEPMASLKRERERELPEEELETEPSMEDLVQHETARIKQLELKKSKLQKLKLAKEKRALEASRTKGLSTPPPPPPPTTLFPSFQPGRPVISQPFSTEVFKDNIPPLKTNWQTPTITKFLSAQRRTPSASASGAWEESAGRGDVQGSPPVKPLEEEGEPVGLLRLLRKSSEEEERMEVKKVEEREEVEEGNMTVMEKVEEKVEELLITMQMEAILSKLWITFGDILRQSPSAPQSGEPLPPKETFDLLTSLSQSDLPQNSISTSSSSIISSTPPLHPLTPQGVLLANVFLALLTAEDHAVPMSEIKGRLATLAGGDDQGVKAIYWGVGKRGLMIRRGGGEAKLTFA